MFLFHFRCQHNHTLRVKQGFLTNTLVNKARGNQCNAKNYFTYRHFNLHICLRIECAQSLQLNCQEIHRSHRHAPSTKLNSVAEIPVQTFASTNKGQNCCINTRYTNMREYFVVFERSCMSHPQVQRKRPCFCSNRQECKLMQKGT